MATQYQYWAPNEINQMLMVADNEIGINTDDVRLQCTIQQSALRVLQKYCCALNSYSELRNCTIV